MKRKKSLEKSTESQGNKEMQASNVAKPSFDLKEIYLQSEIDSEEEVYLPTGNSQNGYDLLKFMGIIIY